MDVDRASKLRTLRISIVHWVMIMANDDDYDLTPMLARYGIRYGSREAACGPGWHQLIERLVVDLIALGWNKECGQIKEKFGALRFYIGSAQKELHDRIKIAEDESARTCEECGEPGKQVGESWIKTRCVKHEDI